MELKNCKKDDTLRIEFWDLGIIGKLKVEENHNYFEIMPRGVAWGGFVKADATELVIQTIVSRSILNDEEDYEGYMIVLPINTIFSWENYTQGTGVNYIKQNIQSMESKEVK